MCHTQILQTIHSEPDRKTGLVRKESLNILFFTHHLNHGGAEKTVRTLSTYFNTHDMGFASYICVVYDDPDMPEYPQNVIVMRHRSKPGDSKLKKACNVLSQIREMKEIKRNYQIDVCISFLPGADIINVLSGVGEKQIVSVRNTESMFVKNVWKKWYVQTAYRKCDYIVATSSVVLEDCISYFGAPKEKICAICNVASPLSRTGEATDAYQAFCETHMTYINVGRLAPEKGQVHLLRAFADFVNRHENEFMNASKTDKVSAHEFNQKTPGLVLVGDGELRTILMNLAERLGISKHVLFCGNQPNPADYLEKADVFVLSSDVEGAANVLIEALQCGMACISTDCGAARDILNPDIGSAESAEKDIQASKIDLRGEPTGDVPSPGTNVSVNASVNASVNTSANTSVRETRGMELATYGILVPTCGTVQENIEEIVARRELSAEEQLLSDAMEHMYLDDALREHYRSTSKKAVEPLSLEAICKQWRDVIMHTMQ